MDDMDDVPDVMQQHAIVVYTKSGQRETGFEHQGYFGELRIVPYTALQGRVRDEAPPGPENSFPENRCVGLELGHLLQAESMIWYDHPFFTPAIKNM